MVQGKLVTHGVNSENSRAEAGGAIALENGTDGSLKDTRVTGAGAETVGGAIVLVGLVAWQLAGPLFGIRAYLLPSPVSVAT